MKTKNRKRIGPVPITLVAVFALAAFLAAGFLTPGNAQARADGECGFNIADGGGATGIGAISADNDKTGTTGADGDDANCNVTGDSVTVKIENMDTETDANIVVLVSGGTKFRTLQGSISGTDVGKVGINEIILSVPKQRRVGRTDTPGEATFTVSKSMADGAGEVLIGAWNGNENSIETVGTSPPTWPTSGGEFQTITFYGAPALGSDHTTNDRNTIVDDWQQCTTTNNDGTFDPATTDPEGLMANCGGQGNDDTVDTDDTAESRSKLESREGGAVTGETLANLEDGTTAPVKIVINGGSMEHGLADDATSADITAHVEDSAGHRLNKVDVEFVFASEPADIVRRAPYNTQTDTDGLATYTVSGLPNKGPYRVTVTVTAGTLNLGSIVVANDGDLAMVSAEACAMVMMGETDTKMDGCMTSYNPKMVYGPKDMFSIYAKATDQFGTNAMTDTFMVKPATAATWWDTLNCMEMNDAVMPMDEEPPVGPDDMTSPYCKMYAGLSAEAMPVVMRAFGKAYGDATKAFNITATGTEVTDNTVMLTVKDDAPGAKYLLDVVASTGADDTLITKSDQVRVIVSGKLDEYTVDGPDYIALNGSSTYTVTAMDENGNPPVFAVEKNKVRILVQPNTVLVTNLDNDDLTLVRNTGMGEFTVYAPLGAADGAPGRIIVGSGAMQVIKNVTFGEAPPEMVNQAPMAGADIADQTVMAGETVTVQSTITDADMDTLTWSETSDMEMYATATVDTMGMVTITGVAAGTATITVTASDPDGASDMQTIMVTVEAEPEPMETMAPTGGSVSVLRSSITVSWTPNSAQGTTLIKVALFNEDITDLANVIAEPVKAFNLVAADPGAHTFNNVPSGMYRVVLAAVDSDGMHVTTVLPGTVTVN